MVPLRQGQGLADLHGGGGQGSEGEGRTGGLWGVYSRTTLDSVHHHRDQQPSRTHTVWGTRRHALTEGWALGRLLCLHYLLLGDTTPFCRWEN